MDSSHSIREPCTSWGIKNMQGGMGGWCGTAFIPQRTRRLIKISMDKRHLKLNLCSWITLRKSEIGICGKTNSKKLDKENADL